MLTSADSCRSASTHYRPSDASSLTFGDDAGCKGRSGIAVVLKRLGSSTYDVAIKIIADIGVGNGLEDAWL